MQNPALDSAVYLAVAGAVNRAMGGAIDGGRAVRDAVYVAMGQAVNRAVHGAVSQSSEPPHLGLGLYLKG